jgi:Rhomboid family
MTLAFGSAAEARVPNLGASGAIAAVLGAYFVLYPNSTVRGLVVIFPVRLSAWFFLGAWFLYQLIEANFGIFGSAANGGGVAFFAHVGSSLGSRFAGSAAIRRSSRKISRPARPAAYPDREQGDALGERGHVLGRGRGHAGHAEHAVDQGQPLERLLALPRAPGEAAAVLGVGLDALHRDVVETVEPAVRRYELPSGEQRVTALGEQLVGRAQHVAEGRAAGEAGVEGVLGAQQGVPEVAVEVEHGHVHLELGGQVRAERGEQRLADVDVRHVSRLLPWLPSSIPTRWLTEDLSPGKPTGHVPGSRGGPTAAPRSGLYLPGGAVWCERADSVPVSASVPTSIPSRNQGLIGLSSVSRCRAERAKLTVDLFSRRRHGAGAGAGKRRCRHGIGDSACKHCFIRHASRLWAECAVLDKRYDKCGAEAVAGTNGVGDDDRDSGDLDSTVG